MLTLWFYIDGKNIDDTTLDNLNDLIYSLLTKIYPTKAVEDFEINEELRQ